MDEVTFLRFDLTKIAKDGIIDDNTLSGIAAIRNGSFNPEDVGAEAKRKMLFDSIVKVIKQFKVDPSDDFIRFILGCTPTGSKIGKMTQKIVDANRDLVRAAMDGFVAQEALARFGYTPKDVVPTQPAAVVVNPPAVGESEAEAALLPTETEAEVLTYARNRLFFLVRNDVLFGEVQKVSYKKTKASFRVFYGTPNAGSLFDFRQQKDGKPTLHFMALEGIEVSYIASPELDDCLLKAFTARVIKAGVAFDTAPVLRTIQGGQATA
jgi:hypothetical protein